MRSMQNILLVIHPTSATDPALERGKQLAKALDAELKVLLCDPHQAQGEYLEQLLSELRREGLRAYGEQAMVEPKHSCAAILAAQQQHNADLVIKQHHPDSQLRKLLSPPDDWQLSRQLPVPLLLVKSERPWAGGTILAAMDVDHQDPQHRMLQGNVMNYAVDLCGLFAAELHVVSAYDVPSLDLADPVAHHDQAIALYCHDQCQWFQREYELAEHRLHIGEGPARALIPRIAHEQGAVLTVLGTIARSGLEGILIGNTAEAVLDGLESDVLVLKPYEAPARLAEQSNDRVAYP
ncbi:MAG TPA: universal stress protein [Pseudomonas sp.]|nr:universal stress protein [Pseudomonas sp.]